MKTIEFKESNVVYAEGDSIYETHAYRDESIRGDKDIVVCYKLNFWERLMVLITGRIWLTQKTYDGILRPLWLTTLKKQLLTNRKQRRDKEKKEAKVKKKIDIQPPGETLSAVK